MLTVLSVIGTRPEAVKMAPVVKALAQHPDEIKSVVCATGQHREMLDQVLSLFQIQPDYNLDVMTANQSLTVLTGNLLRGLESVVEQVKPDWLLAQGDTTSVMTAGLVAYYHQLKFGHVEAGLRTGDKFRPFPEEGNRLIADALADACFAPTTRAAAALLREGCSEARIFTTGNTVVDALLDVASRPYDWDKSPLAGLPRDKRLVMVTAHRRESFGEPFRDLCHALRDIAVQFDDVHLVYPVHLNPNVQKPVYEILSDVPNITLMEPLPYPALIQLMKHSALVLTDSGGIQEEAPTFGVPLLVMRETTERPEGIEAGVSRLVGTSRERIITEAARLLSDETARQAMRGKNPYGDGKAAARIVNVLLKGRMDG